MTDNLRILFQSITDEYIAYPTALGETLPGRFTAEMILSAAVGVPDGYKPRVLAAFAKKAWIGSLSSCFLSPSSLVLY